MPQKKDIEYLALANNRKDALGIADDSDDLMLFLQLALILIFQTFTLDKLHVLFTPRTKSNAILFFLGTTRSHVHISDNTREIKKCQKGH